SARAAAAPSYMRSRPGGGGRNYGYRSGFGASAFGLGFGFAAPFYQPPVVSGFYYERPYPYHFDYYRSRWGAPSPAAAFDWPCETPMP
ncbi:MAG: hypothetical protein AAF961_08445, partial [Planctomycetota bacterium]